MAEYLSALNTNQRLAVEYPSSIQILAGPGAGKTRVLTTRVAHLVQQHALDPARIVVVTFTNKAALEMRSRLEVLLGAKASKLVMGTFHSVCVRYLRRYGGLVGLQNNFVVADRDACLGMLKRAIAAVVPLEDRKEHESKVVIDKIGRLKSSGLSVGEYRAENDLVINISARQRRIHTANIWEEYETEKERDNALDFDDLLVYGRRLFEEQPQVAGAIKHVLVDEFQDTNAVQYQIVKLLAASSRTLTIVGDPDQSIYGWRSADISNLGRMSVDFAPAGRIFLEQNYRSTKAIVGGALKLIRQDTGRIDKSMSCEGVTGSSIVLCQLDNARAEASFIVGQIQHLVAYHGGVLDYGDFAILLRFGALSMQIELELGRVGIPCRVLCGRKFFDRAEVQDIVAYLQLIDNPSYTAAFSRCAARIKDIGTKTLSDLIGVSKARGISAFTLCVKLAAGQTEMAVTKTKRKRLEEFVKLVQLLQASVSRGSTVPELIDQLCKEVDYEGYLARTQGPDAPEKWLNVLELKTYAVTVAEEKPVGVQQAQSEQEDGSEYGGMSAVDHLRNFLEVSMLATNAETSESKTDANARKVTLSTVHSAKGLEWPVILVPAVEDDIFPSFRSSGTEAEIAEERRLLYVAITRAQAYCFLTHVVNRLAAGSSKQKTISRFLGDVQKSTLFVEVLQKITQKSRAEITGLLGRKSIDEEVTKGMIAKHLATLPPPPPVVEYQDDFGLSHPTTAPTTNRYARTNTSFVSPALASTSNGLKSLQTTANASNGLKSLQTTADKWNTLSSSSMAGAGVRATVPPNSGFASALHVHRTMPALPLPPLSPEPAPVVKAPPKKVLPKGKQLPLGQPKLSFGAALPRTTAPPSKFVVETRQSRIDEAVLVNPIGKAEAERPTIERLVQGEQNALELMKNLGREGGEKRSNDGGDQGGPKRAKGVE